MSGNAVGRHAVDDDDFNCLSPVELIQVVGLGPQCDVFELVSSGLDVAGWNYDICVVEVNLVSRGGSGKIGCIKGHWSDSGFLDYAGRDVHQS